MGLDENPKRSAMTDCAITAIQTICTFELMEAQRCFTLEPRDEDGKALKIGMEDYLYKLVFLEDDDGLNKARGFVQATAQVCGQPFIVKPGDLNATLFIRRDVILKEYGGDMEALKSVMKANKWTLIG